MKKQKELFISDKIDLIDKELEEKHLLVDTINLASPTSISAILFCLAGKMLSAPMASVAIFPLSWALCTLSIAFCNRYRENYKITNLIKVKKHLNKMRNQEIKSTPFLNKKRVNKINFLKGKRSKAKRNEKRLGIARILLLLASSTGLLAKMYPPLLFVGTGLFTVAEIIDVIKLRRYKEISTLNARISNLENDLDIIEIESKENKTNSNNKQKSKNSKKNNQITKTKTKENPTTATSKSNMEIIRENEAAINKYINDLENARNIDRGAYKVKK